MRHIEDLRKAKSHAHLHSTQDWLLQMAPQVSELLQRLAARHGSLGTAVAQLSKLAQSYGIEEFCAAVAEAIQNDAWHTQSVRHLLQVRRARQGRPEVDERRNETLNRPGEPAPEARDLAVYDRPTGGQNAQ